MSISLLHRTSFAIRLSARLWKKYVYRHRTFHELNHTLATYRIDNTEFQARRDESYFYLYNRTSRFYNKQKPATLKQYIPFVRLPALDTRHNDASNYRNSLSREQVFGGTFPDPRYILSDSISPSIVAARFLLRNSHCQTDDAEEIYSPRKWMHCQNYY